MNLYAAFILAALSVEFVLDILARLLNLRALTDDLPQEFQGVYEADDYRKSQAYTRENTRAGMLRDCVQLGALLAFWFAGGFNWLDQSLRALGLSDLVTGLLFIGALALAQGALSLPFALYATFGIEERYGFNKTTPATFAADVAKGLALLIALGGPLIAGILFFFQWQGASAWLYCWGAVTAWTLAVQWIAPTWIMPLFNKFTPLEEGDLKRDLLRYASRVGFSLRDVSVMDGSRRSSKANAFFTGFGKRRRVALFDTLIDKHEPSEVVAVLAHEIGHWKKRHIGQGLAIAAAHSGLLFFLLSRFLGNPSLFGAFYMEQTSIYASLVFFGLLYAPVESLLGVLLNALSRRNEFEADRFARDTLDDPEDLVQGLKRLAKDTLTNLRPHKLHVFMNHSHPPVLDRIRALRSG